jgi:hypothetical protein
LQLFDTTLYGNTATGGNGGADAAAGAALGGAIYNDEGALVLRNSTLSGNSAASGVGSSPASSRGGAIYSQNGSVDIYNSTITNNAATSARDVYLIALGPGKSATAHIYSSIIAHADLPAPGFDLIATEDQGGHMDLSGANNLIRKQNDYQSITIVAADPLLGALAANGGPTLTHALLANSPAIGQGSNLLNLPNDQRGSSYARMAGGAADIGAFEVQVVGGPALPGDYNGNLVVDAGDYVVWRKTQGATVPPFAGADGNGDTHVDSAERSTGRPRIHFGDRAADRFPNPRSPNDDRLYGTSQSTGDPRPIAGNSSPARRRQYAASVVARRGTPGNSFPATQSSRSN